MSPQDLDRLEALLSAPHLSDSLALDALQGFFCAIASSPVPTPREKWLPAAMGDARFANDEEAAQVTALLERFAEATARQLGEGLGLDLVCYPAEDGEEELAPWCEGFLLGVGHADPAWYDAGEPEDVDELLHPFLLLSGHLKAHAEEEGEPWLEPAEEKAQVEAARRLFYDAIHAAWEWRFEARVNRVPVKREEAKTGRNDPCPCGSGKKYKACHGRD